MVCFANDIAFLKQVYPLCVEFIAFKNELPCGDQ